MTFERAIAFDPTTAVWPNAQQSGYCQAHIGGKIEKLRGWMIPCSKKARYNAIIYFGTQPEDIVSQQICGKHLQKFQRLGFQIESEQIAGWKPNHGH